MCVHLDFGTNENEWAHRASTISIALNKPKLIGTHWKWMTMLMAFSCGRFFLFYNHLLELCVGKRPKDSKKKILIFLGPFLYIYLWTIFFSLKWNAANIYVHWVCIIFHLVVCVVKQYIALSHKNDENCITQWHFPWKLNIISKPLRLNIDKNCLIISIEKCVCNQQTQPQQWRQCWSSDSYDIVEKKNQSVQHLYANW